MICKICNKEFTKNIYNQIYCSPKCANHASYLKEKDKDSYKKRARRNVDKWNANNKDKVYAGVKRWIDGNKDRHYKNVLKAVHKRRSQSKGENTLTVKQWEQIQADYHHKCVYCGSGGKMTMEHVTPLSKGGAHTSDNVVPACLGCNRKKNRKPLLLFLFQRLFT